MGARGQVVWCIYGNYAFESRLGAPPGASAFLKDGVVGIGWRHLGDLRAIPADQISVRKRVDGTYPEDDEWFGTDREQWVGQSAGMIFRFAHGMRVGDIVILPTTQIDRRLHVGKVTGDYEHRPQYGDEYHHIRRVEWRLNIPRESLSRETLRYLGVQGRSIYRVHVTPELASRLVGL